ncbi:hypothetical protein ALC56_14031 [Trachymyrmex septentrionalis]|uniref:Uncharacterized protein n=1 Tax=Trachymyrmex septentrionalis TaxID=34720 RepID=A0A195EVG7_9HYME|nr:hypothetical protein ALC56_14031 [Trachymyrmex septentrionalis]
MGDSGNRLALYASSSRFDLLCSEVGENISINTLLSISGGKVLIRVYNKTKVLTLYQSDLMLYQEQLKIFEARYQDREVKVRNRENMMERENANIKNELRVVSSQSLDESNEYVTLALAAEAERTRLLELITLLNQRLGKERNKADLLAV